MLQRQNLHIGDRATRVALGITMGLIGLTYPLFQFTPFLIIGLVGLVPLLTGLFGFCPLYRIFGFRTNSKPTSAMG